MRPRGFTLVEVMVALAIVAIALGAGLRAAASLTDNAERLDRVLAAQWCAENLFTNLHVARNTPGVGDTDVNCEQLGHRFTGTVSASPLPFNTNLLRRVSVVFRDESGRPVVTLTTMMVR